MELHRLYWIYYLVPTHILDSEEDHYTAYVCAKSCNIQNYPHMAAVYSIALFPACHPYLLSLAVIEKQGGEPCMDSHVTLSNKITFCENHVREVHKMIISTHF